MLFCCTRHTKQCQNLQNLYLSTPLHLAIVTAIPSVVCNVHTPYSNRMLNISAIFFRLGFETRSLNTKTKTHTHETKTSYQYNVNVQNARSNTFNC